MPRLSTSGAKPLSPIHLHGTVANSNTTNLCAICWSGFMKEASASSVRDHDFFIETHGSIRAYIVMFVILCTLSAGEQLWQMLKHSDLRFSERWVLRLRSSGKWRHTIWFRRNLSSSYSLNNAGVTLCQIPQDHNPNNVEYCSSTKEQLEEHVFFLTTKTKLLSITCVTEILWNQTCKSQRNLNGTQPTILSVPRDYKFPKNQGATPNCRSQNYLLKQILYSWFRAS